MHKGMAFIDVISPCVTFNDHEGSTKSYAYTREHNVEIVQADFVPPSESITTECEAGSVRSVMLRWFVGAAALAEDYDRPIGTGRTHVRDRQRAGEVVTGLLYLSADSGTCTRRLATIAEPLCNQPFEQLCPGNAELLKLDRAASADALRPRPCAGCYSTRYRHPSPATSSADHSGRLGSGVLDQSRRNARRS